MVPRLKKQDHALKKKHHHVSLATGPVGVHGPLVQLLAKKVNKLELENVHALMALSQIPSVKEKPSKLNLATTDLAHLNAPGLAGAHGLNAMPTVINLET